MNSDLEQFSEEELTEIIKDCTGEIYNTPTSDETTVSPRILLSLARIALAAKQAKPVEWGALQQEFLDEDRSLFTDQDEANAYSESCYGLTPLYTTPQPAHTEQDGWKLVPEEATIAMLTLLGMTGSFEFMQQKYKNMLAAAPKPESEG